MVILIYANVSNSSGTQEMVLESMERYGRPDCVFDNSGISEGSARNLTPDYSVEDWDRVLRINLIGVWLSMKTEIPQMLANGGGSIVNTASIMGLICSPGSIAYMAAKHGALGLIKAAALEYAKAKVRVNAVCLW